MRAIEGIPFRAPQIDQNVAALVPDHHVQVSVAGEVGQVAGGAAERREDVIAVRAEAFRRAPENARGVGERFRLVVVRVAERQNIQVAVPVEIGHLHARQEARQVVMPVRTEPVGAAGENAYPRHLPEGQVVPPVEVEVRDGAVPALAAHRQLLAPVHAVVRAGPAEVDVRGKRRAGLGMPGHGVAEHDHRLAVGVQVARGDPLRPHRGHPAAAIG